VELFVQGLLLGLGVTAMIGPITLTILDSSLTAGWRMGIVAASAMWLSDIIYISISFYTGKVLLSFGSGAGGDIWFDIFAGIVLIIIGIVLWRMRGAKVSASGVKRSETVGHFIRGFVVNSVSPFTMVFWPTITISMVSDEQLSQTRALWLYSGILVALIAGDTLKAVFASWIRTRISDRLIRQIKSLISVGFVCIGLFLIVRAIWLHYPAA
jgi:threonine/homoserine/homoserine lactone efflux protein